MAGASSSWRVAVMRPGEDPIGNLAYALASRDVLGSAAPDDDFAATAPVLLEATLRRGARGLADALKQARIPRDENLLVLVDQFEELFRFRRNTQIANSRDESIAFVRLLLEASRQRDQPAYIVLTMRSDFVGDCMDYPRTARKPSTRVCTWLGGCRAMRYARRSPVRLRSGVAPSNRDWCIACSTISATIRISCRWCSTP